MSKASRERVLVAMLALRTPEQGRCGREPPVFNGDPDRPADPFTSSHTALVALGAPVPNPPARSRHLHTDALMAAGPTSAAPSSATSPRSPSIRSTRISRHGRVPGKTAGPRGGTARPSTPTPATAGRWPGVGAASSGRDEHQPPVRSDARLGRTPLRNLLYDRGATHTIYSAQTSTHQRRLLDLLTDGSGNAQKTSRRAISTSISPIAGGAIRQQQEQSLRRLRQFDSSFGFGRCAPRPRRTRALDFVGTRPSTATARLPATVMNPGHRIAIGPAG
jgi:hypothetical protein